MSSKVLLPPPAQIQRTMEYMWQPGIKNDLLKWVQYAYPWGAKNTPLENFERPRAWQCDELNRMSEHIHNNLEMMRKGDTPEIYMSATVSGRGPGKTGLLSMISNWMISVNLGSSTVVAANTDNQLTNFTFAEINKWLTMSINHYWWDTTQTVVKPMPWFADALKKDKMIDSKYYYVLGRLWTAEEPVKFAGLHNQAGFLLIFDEASGIAKPIWDVSSGFFTEISPYRFHLAYSNPRNNTGPFFECFHSNKKYWYTRQIDSRSVEGADVKYLNRIIEEAGIDSDKARIEVLGEFPLQGDLQFISRGVVEAACKRELDKYDDGAALVMGIDTARFGPDDTAIRFRQGRDARSIPSTVVNGMNVMAVVDIAVNLICKYNPQAIFVDVGGVGAGVHDCLERLGYNVIAVDFGSKAEDQRYYDCRTECWGRMRDWLTLAQLPGDGQKSDAELIEDLCTPLYEYLGREGKLKLESKDKMKSRGFSSPDNADSLAITFYKEICRTDSPLARHGHKRTARKAHGVGSEVIFE